MSFFSHLCPSSWNLKGGGSISWNWQVLFNKKKSKSIACGAVGQPCQHTEHVIEDQTFKYNKSEHIPSSFSSRASIPIQHCSQPQYSSYVFNGTWPWLEKVFLCYRFRVLLCKFSAVSQIPKSVRSLEEGRYNPCDYGAIVHLGHCSNSCEPRSSCSAVEMCVNEGEMYRLEDGSHFSGQLAEYPQNKKKIKAVNCTKDNYKVSVSKGPN